MLYHFAIIRNDNAETGLKRCDEYAHTPTYLKTLENGGTSHRNLCLEWRADKTVVPLGQTSAN